MKTEEEIKKEIKEYKNLLRQRAKEENLVMYYCIYGAIQALEWVLEDENELCS